MKHKKINSLPSKKAAERTKIGFAAIALGMLVFFVSLFVAPPWLGFPFLFVLSVVLVFGGLAFERLSTYAYAIEHYTSSKSVRRLDNAEISGKDWFYAGQIIIAALLLVLPSVRTSPNPYPIPKEVVLAIGILWIFLAAYRWKNKEKIKKQILARK